MVQNPAAEAPASLPVPAFFNRRVENWDRSSETLKLCEVGGVLTPPAALRFAFCCSAPRLPGRSERPEAGRTQNCLRAFADVDM